MRLGAYSSCLLLLQIKVTHGLVFWLSRGQCVYLNIYKDVGAIILQFSEEGLENSRGTITTCF